jgi:hypothetical protein
MTSELEFIRRVREFDGPIAQLGLNNQIVHRDLFLYACGQIETKELALVQMVLDLATAWDALLKRELDEARRAVLPPQWPGSSGETNEPVP